MRDIWRRYWPVDLLAVVFLVVALLFGSYLQYRQQLADQRAERTRQSLCAVINRIPMNVDSGIDEARRLDNCGKPHPPTVFFGHPVPTPTVTVTPSPRPASAEAPAPAGATPAPAPTVTRTVHPTPHPSPSTTPRHHPSPSPSPTPTRCVAIPILHPC